MATEPDAHILGSRYKTRISQLDIAYKKFISDLQNKNTQEMLLNQHTHVTRSITATPNNTYSKARSSFRTSLQKLMISASILRAKALEANNHYYINIADKSLRDSSNMLITIGSGRTRRRRVVYHKKPKNKKTHHRNNKKQ
jgi:hypothetical protein